MRARSRLALAILAFVAATGCAAPGAESPVAAPSPDGDAGDIAALESAFWDCDWVATTEGVLATPMAACQFATGELKARKFGGSSRALAAWWRANKDAEHGRLERTARR